MKICHLTSAHPQYDVRIFVKECSSLAKHYFTSLIVVNGKEETINNVSIYSVDYNFKSRLSRFTKIVKLVLKRAIELDADVYHIHDPELLRIVSKLKKLGKRVIYDAHEDLPEQILSKPWINKFIRKLVANYIRRYENKKAIVCDYIITATPYIRDRFLKINTNTIDINNYPLQSEVVTEQIDIKNKKIICYIGGISKIRGIEQIVKSLDNIKEIKLKLAGKFSSIELHNEISNLNSWNKVEELGFIDRDETMKVMQESIAGLVLLLPEPNHINAQPNKMFEYMAAGLPVIASDFPLWKEIIEDNNCGICVNPLNPEEISKAIQFIIDNPDKAKIMGENGRRLAKEKYNWESEEMKLINAYQSLLKAN